MRQPDVRYIRTPDLVGSGNRNATQQVGIDLVLWMRPAGVGPWCHARQPHQSHQPLYPLAIDRVTNCLEIDHPSACAIERMPRVLLVDQSTVQQVEFIGRPGGLLRIDGGPGDAGQGTLPNQAHLRINANPRLSHYHRLIPDFFLSQSSSTFNLPISPYSRSGS